jgi:hypothetical protein
MRKIIITTVMIIASFTQARAGCRTDRSIVVPGTSWTECSDGYKSRQDRSAIGGLHLGVRSRTWEVP